MTSSRLPRVVAIDTDPGIDDALALILAWRSPELRVELVTTVAGNVPVSAASANARRVISLLRPPTPPVLAQGAARPLRRALQTAPSVHGDDGLGGITDRRGRAGQPLYPPAPDLRMRRDAPGRIIELARRHGSALTIVAIGPLTNIARAVRRAPASMRGIGRLIVMGGAVEVPGNVTPTAEFNFYVDPHAADAVLQSGLPTTLVPLDVTRRVRLTRAMLREHLGRARSPLARAIRDMTDSLLQRDAGGMALHDPLAVALTVDPELVETTPMPLAVETHGRYTLGMSVANRAAAPDVPEHTRRAARATRIDVATAVDAPGMLELFCSRALRGEIPGAGSESRPPSVVVVGSANVDYTVAVPHLPSPGETVMGSEVGVAFGGKGANQAVAARRAGARVRFLGKLGVDEHGRSYTRHLRAEGIGLSGLVRDAAAPSGVALIVVDRRGQNQIAVGSGANATLAPAELRTDTLANAPGVLVAQLESPLATVEAALRLAKKAGLCTVLNPAPARALPRRLCRLVDVLVPNEVEAALLSDRPVSSVREARAALRALRACGYPAVVLTLGRRGVLWADSDRVHHLRALPVEVHDTTAAGDTFVGYLACALAEAQPLAAAIAFANAAAGLSVTRAGAQPSIPRRSAVQARLSGFLDTHRAPTTTPADR